jgi:predicted dehydrogenase
MNSALSPLRAGIIGLGYIGGGDQVSGDAIGGQLVGNLDGTHAEALSRNPGVHLVAGSSRDAGRRQRFEKRTGCKTYADWKEMLDRERLEIVSVATYAPVHAEMTLGCVERGVRAVYCEKPMATRLADAERMAGACEKAGALLVINHNRRFNPNYRRLRDAVADGVLGDLTSASLRWGNGRLGNTGTHLIDAVCMVTGRNVRAVSATLDPSNKPDCRGALFHDPGGFGWMRLDGGLMTAVDGADYGKGGAHMILNGALGRAITTAAGEVRLEFWDGRSDHWPSPQGAPTSMDRAVGEIVDALEGKGPFSYGAAPAVRTLEAIVAFHASHARQGAWVGLPLEAGDREIEVRCA